MTPPSPFFRATSLAIFLTTLASFVLGSETVRVDSIPSFDWPLETDAEKLPNTSPYIPMTYVEGETWYESTFYRGTEDWARVGRDWAHPGEHAASVRAFTFPRDGLVSISGRAAKAHVDAQSDGVDVEIRVNDEIIAQEYLTGDDERGVRFFIKTPIKENDVVRFIVRRHDKHFCDTTRFDPTVAYLDGDRETFAASDGFDADECDGQRRWSYETLPDEPAFERPKPEGYGADFGATIRYEWLREDKIAPGDSLAYSTCAIKHLRLARTLYEDLADSFDEETAAAFNKRLQELESQNAESLAPPDAEKFYAAVRGFKRKLIFSNELYQNAPLLFVKRAPTGYNHLVMQYFGWRAQKGGGIFILQEPGKSLACRDIFDGKLAEGCVLEPRLSFDAKKVVFSWVDLSNNPTFDPYKVHFTDPDEGFYHVWSANIDGTELKQLTSGSFDDITPTFLPDGKIAFSSTRRRGYARCFWWGFGRRWHVYTIHTMAPDGTDIKTLSWHDTNEWFPETANDGRLVYARWDYIDRDAVTHQNLWSMRPDGTNPSALWGNATPSPHCAFQARAIPNSGKFVFTASAHHSSVGGSIAVVDPTVAIDGQEAVQRVTPSVRFPEAESLELPEYYESPYPLSEKYFYVSYSPKPLRWEWQKPQDADALGIYTLDVFGNRELVYRSPTLCAVNAQPIIERETPPVWSSQLPKDAPNYGEMSVVDVYKGLGDKVERGSIKELRVVQLFPKVTRDSDNPPIGKAREENGRAILGTVPVEEDGSAYFRVPAQTPFYLQAIDRDGNAYQTMRSLTYLQPGEKISCIGCHERRDSSGGSGFETYSADASHTLAAKRAPSIIKPDRLSGRPFSYPHDIQPILDAKCLSCHNETNAQGQIDLSGTPCGEGKDAFTRSYMSLMDDRDFWGEGTNPKNAAEALVPRFGARNTIQITEPGGMYGALGSRLMKMLREGHEDVKLSDEELRTIAAWIDLNGIFYGVDNEEGQKIILDGGVAPMPEVQ